MKRSSHNHELWECANRCLIQTVQGVKDTKRPAQQQWWIETLNIPNYEEFQSSSAHFITLFNIVLLLPETSQCECSVNDLQAHAIAVIWNYIPRLLLEKAILLETASPSYFTDDKKQTHIQKHCCFYFSLFVSFACNFYCEINKKNKLIDWCFTARQHKIGQFVPIYQGDYCLGRLSIANEEHTKTYSCMRSNEHTHATTNNRYALLA